ncbi:MAG: type II toxin-antitoxin system Phd/YefM family antitoxin [Gemmatimonadetes bacterium]|jgi:antitoxin Phd|nr:type II toxin-antitoxin system Phd/YefM family antitoxin [Gemmatimonadota bacterium]MBT6148212.1 type II toxin-antitoxin system Phd/YefM family antitoxin [Gemmatimonadota bacterium]MBT7864504.1 type II toxin-antitoxin system Phd/YefM family antitoxin [Gemmatimonadota bacterium]
MTEPKRWQLQEAKNKLSRVAEEAVTYGPQVITKHGEDAVVVISKSEYERLTRPTLSLAQFLASSPLAGSELVTQRDPAPGRMADLP